MLYSQPCQYLKISLPPYTLLTHKGRANTVLKTPHNDNDTLPYQLKQRRALTHTYTHAGARRTRGGPVQPCQRVRIQPRAQLCANPPQLLLLSPLNSSLLVLESSAGSPLPHSLTPSLTHSLTHSHSLSLPLSLSLLVLTSLLILAVVFMRNSVMSK